MTDEYYSKQCQAFVKQMDEWQRNQWHIFCSMNGLRMATNGKGEMRVSRRTEKLYQGFSYAKACRTWLDNGGFEWTCELLGVEVNDD